MIKQKGELRRMNSEGKKQRQGILLIVLFMFVLAITGASSAAEKEGQWEGVDKVVVARQFYLLVPELLVLLLRNLQDKQKNSSFHKHHKHHQDISFLRLLFLLQLFVVLLLFEYNFLHILLYNLPLHK